MDAKGVLALLSISVILGLPIYLAIKRQFNIALSMFYLLATAFVVDDLAGGWAQLTPLKTVMFFIVAFGIFSFFEYWFLKKDKRLAFISLCVLWFFAFIVYMMGMEGAFA